MHHGPGAVYKLVKLLSFELALLLHHSQQTIRQLWHSETRLGEYGGLLPGLCHVEKVVVIPGFVHKPFLPEALLYDRGPLRHEQSLYGPSLLVAFTLVAFSVVDATLPRRQCQPDGDSRLTTKPCRQRGEKT